MATTTPNLNKLHTEMIPGCCGLKTVVRLSCLGKTDAVSKEEAKEFDKICELGTAATGNWNSYGKAKDTIAIITTSGSYKNSGHEFEKQKKFLEDKGWKLLCSWKSYESGMRNYMYGSPGIKVGE